MHCSLATTFIGPQCGISIPSPLGRLHPMLKHLASRIPHGPGVHLSTITALLPDEAILHRRHTSCGARNVNSCVKAFTTSFGALNRQHLHDACQIIRLRFHRRVAYFLFFYGLVCSRDVVLLRSVDLVCIALKCSGTYNSTCPTPLCVSILLLSATLSRPGVTAQCRHLHQ